MRAQTELVVRVYRLRVGPFVRRRHVLGEDGPANGVADVLVREPAEGVDKLGELVCVFEAEVLEVDGSVLGEDLV